VSEDRPDRDEVFDFLAEERQDWRDPEEHPSPEALTAYQADELSPEEDERIQEHLAQCRHCTEMLLELEEFLQPEGVGEEPVADFEAEADQRKLRPQMHGSKRRLTTYAVAAVLFMAVFGLSIYTLSRSPEKFKTLEPLDSERGRPGAVEAVQLPVTLLLKSPAKTAYTEYRAIFWSGKVLARERSPLKQSPSFDVAVPLEDDELAPGEYRIELQGVRNGTTSFVGRYVFRVVGH
jgi:putative zinc finger protein